MNLNQIRGKYQYVDKEGVTRDRTLNIPHYFEEIPFIYSPHLEKGRVKFSARMQKLYCYVADWEKSGGVCYEEQSELAKVCDLSRGKTNDLIELMESIGLLSVTKIPGRRNLELRALPLTDAHITPPEALTEQPVALSDEVPAPTMTKVIEEAVIVAESTTEDDVIIDRACEMLARHASQKPSSLNTFSTFARSTLEREGKKLPERLEDQLEKRFSKRYYDLYSRFDLPF